jgi:opacity protein-like surface antigen
MGLSKVTAAMRTSSAIPFFTIAALFVATPALGQARFGVHTSWSDDMDFGVGVRVVSSVEALHVWSPNLRLVASGDFFFPGDGVDYFELNANLAYLVEARGEGMPRPYVGTGLSFARASIDVLNAADSDLALNLLAGVQFPTGDWATPFVEVRLEVGRGEQLVVSGGVVF